MDIDIRLMAGSFTAVGAAAACFWGFLRAIDAAKETEEVEKFSWVKAAITVIPSVVGGFIAGYQMDSVDIGSAVTLVLAGFGLAKAQTDAGLNAYFD